MNNPAATILDEDDLQEESIVNMSAAHEAADEPSQDEQVAISKNNFLEDIERRNKALEILYHTQPALFESIFEASPASLTMQHRQHNYAMQGIEGVFSGLLVSEDAERKRIEKEKAEADFRARLVMYSLTDPAQFAAACADLQNQVAEMQVTAEALRTEMYALLEDVIRPELSDLQDRLKEINGEIREIKAEVRDIKDQLNTAKDNGESPDIIAALEQKLAEAKDREQDKRLEFRDVRDTRQAVRLFYKDYKDSTNEITSRLEGVENKLKDLQDEARQNGLSSMSEDAQNMLKDLQRQSEELRADLDIKRARMPLLQKLAQHIRENENGSSAAADMVRAMHGNLITQDTLKTMISKSADIMSHNELQMNSSKAMLAALVTTGMRVEDENGQILKGQNAINYLEETYDGVKNGDINPKDFATDSDINDTNQTQDTQILALNVPKKPMHEIEKDLNEVKAFLDDAQRNGGMLSRAEYDKLKDLMPEQELIDTMALNDINISDATYSPAMTPTYFDAIGVRTQTPTLQSRAPTLSPHGISSVGYSGSFADSLEFTAFNDPSDDSSNTFDAWSPAGASNIAASNAFANTLQQQSTPAPTTADAQKMDLLRKQLAANADSFGVGGATGAV